MVLDSNTVIDPRTMMVESLHTSIADCAMPRSWSPNYLTIWADISWVYLFYKHYMMKLINTFYRSSMNVKCSVSGLITPGFNEDPTNKLIAVKSPNIMHING